MRWRWSDWVARPEGRSGLFTLVDKSAEENAKSELRFADGSTTTVLEAKDDDVKDDVVAARVLNENPNAVQVTFYTWRKL